MADKDKKYILQDGENVVACPSCGENFDYMSVSEAGMGYVECPHCSEAVSQKDLEEVEKHTVSTYGPDDDPEEKAKAIKKADEKDVNFHDDGTISVKEDENLEEVEKSQIMKFDLKKGGDVKALQQMFDKGVDSKKITVGTDGTIQVSEHSVKTEGEVISATDFKRMVENHNKIDLSEQEIMSILFESESPRMTKADLISEISKRIIYEADMNDDVRRKFESGENDYTEHLNPDTVRQISQEVFGDIQRNIREKTGRQNVNMMDVQMLLGDNLMRAIQKEQQIGIPQLEQKAVQMIRQQFNIPEDAVDFEAQITGLPQLGGTPIQKGNIQYTKGNKEVPQGKSEEELKPEVTRRRITNAMMHGAARKSQNLHHMDDELRQQDPELNRAYGNIMAANDAMYWMMSDEQIENEGRQGVHAGNVRLDLSNPEKPKIIAQGIVFPILLHELSKGVMELMSLWSLPEDKDVRDYVTDKTDHLEAETNDIRLGSYIWGKFVEQIPVDNQEVISLTFNMLQQLPTDEFNSVMEGLANNQDQAKNTVRQLAQEAIEELSREDYEDAIDQYGPEDEPEAEDDVDTMLGGDVEGGEEPQGEEQPDPSTWSQSEIQAEIDAALDAGDYETVAYLSKYLK